MFWQVRLSILITCCERLVKDIIYREEAYQRFKPFGERIKPLVYLAALLSSHSELIIHMSLDLVELDLCLAKEA